jgi:hypothetical protein
MTTCAVCNHSNHPKARFCANCAAPLSLQKNTVLPRLPPTIMPTVGGVSQ